MFLGPSSLYGVPVAALSHSSLNEGPMQGLLRSDLRVRT